MQIPKETLINPKQGRKVPNSAYLPDYDEIVLASRYKSIAFLGNSHEKK
jgi:hypothetical protein